jgi:hypothetical protein
VKSEEQTLATSSVMVRRSVRFFPKLLMRRPNTRKQNGMAAPCTSAPRLPTAMRSRSHLSAKDNSSWNDTAWSTFFPFPAASPLPPPAPFATADSAIAMRSPPLASARLAHSGQYLRRRGSLRHWTGEAPPLVLSFLGLSGVAEPEGTTSVSVICRGSGWGELLYSALWWSEVSATSVRRGLVCG